MALLADLLPPRAGSVLSENALTEDLLGEVPFEPFEVAEEVPGGVADRGDADPLVAGVDLEEDRISRSFRSRPTAARRESRTPAPVRRGVVGPLQGPEEVAARVAHGLGGGEAWVQVEFRCPGHAPSDQLGGPRRCLYFACSYKTLDSIL